MGRGKSRILSIISFLIASVSVYAQPVVVSVLHNFYAIPEPRNPVTIMLGPGNMIYGVTAKGGDTNVVPSNNAGGTIFKINADGTNFKLLHSFVATETESQQPYLDSGHIGLSVAVGSDGYLYGTAQYGTNGNGMVYKCNNDGNDFSILHSFADNVYGLPLSLIQGADGWLYGTTPGTLFTLDTQGENFRVLHTFSASDEGYFALGRLLQSNDGTLYGTTAHVSTDTGPGGAVFKCTTNGTFTVLHTFPAFSGDGIEPTAGLIQGSDGALYGTTIFGGTNSAGTVFKMNTDGSGYQILHSFGTGNAGTSDGENPYGELLQGPNGVLYGTTQRGTNIDSSGTVFRIGIDGSGYNVLYNFAGNTNGTIPSAGLVLGPATGSTGLIYGTARDSGGVNGVGTLFSMLVNPPASITPVANPVAGGQAIVYWPAWAYNYVLQSTTNLDSPNWTTVSNATPVMSVVVSNGAPATYYRLVSP